MHLLLINHSAEVKHQSFSSVKSSANVLDEKLVKSN